jgi:hypothetical protein
MFPPIGNCLPNNATVMPPFRGLLGALYDESCALILACEKAASEASQSCEVDSSSIQSGPAVDEQIHARRVMARALLEESQSRPKVLTPGQTMSAPQLLCNLAKFDKNQRRIPTEKLAPGRNRGGAETRRRNQPAWYVQSHRMACAKVLLEPIDPTAAS